MLYRFLDTLKIFHFKHSIVCIPPFPMSILFTHPLVYSWDRGDMTGEETGISSPFVSVMSPFIWFYYNCATPGTDFWIFPKLYQHQFLGTLMPYLSWQISAFQPSVYCNIYEVFLSLTRGKQIKDKYKRDY